jgi:hypothetical protein
MIGCKGREVAGAAVLKNEEKTKKRRPAALPSVDGLRPVGRFAYAQR